MTACPTRFACCLAAIAILLQVPFVRAQNVRVQNSQPSASAGISAGIDAAFRNFWAADSPAEAARRADSILKTGVTFDDALQRLQLGRTYTDQKSGLIHLSNRTNDGIEHNFAVDIPPSYDPSRRYQVRFQLHGGIGARTDNKPRGSGEIGALAGAEQIYVLPYAWETAPWWGNDQILNLDAIIDSLKRTYNIDENRVVLSGVSAFTLLLSPDKFNFSQPVKVVANGREVFNSRVAPSVQTLLKWAARDNDRTMLYAAELQIKLAR